jgi:hypothetical protein
MTIEVTGAIHADGGLGYARGDGSGGAIRLIAQTIQGEGAVSALSPPNSGNQAGGVGRVRLEACQLNRASLTAPPATVGLPTTVFLVTNPTIRVTAIAGETVSSTPAGLLTQPDVSLPPAFTNPAVISVSASNVAPGTTFRVVLVPANGTNLVGSSTLSGSYAASTGSVTMNVYTDRVWRVNALIDYIPRP